MKSKHGFETTLERSELMRKIKGVNTKTEIIIRKELWSLGYRYRINVKSLPGKPDIVLNKYRLIVFIDGEFWHGYNWPYKKQKIKANRKYWIKKIEGNIERDKKNTKHLSLLGYRVLRFWEHEIKKDLESCVYKILCQINNKTSVKI